VRRTDLKVGRKTTRKQKGKANEEKQGKQKLKSKQREKKEKVGMLQGCGEARAADSFGKKRIIAKITR